MPKLLFIITLRGSFPQGALPPRKNLQANQPMDPLFFLFPSLIILAGVLSRRPFLDFPLDDDFAIYTYRARFACKGFQWKKDLQIIGLPIWRMLLLDKLYADPDKGVRRIRHLQTAFHVAGSLVIFCAVALLTGNPWAALAGGLLHAFYGTSPDLTAGSFNHEQFYIPFILGGLVLLILGKEAVFFAGLCFGLATIPKYTAGLYAAVFMWPVLVRYGIESTAVFVLGSALPFVMSNLLDLKLGFWDAESRKQMRTRMATTLRLTRTKRMYFSIPREIKNIFLQTLPLWVAGLPGLLLSFFGEQGLWMACFTGATLAMIVFQRGFSRYHYLPWIAFLALPSGLAIHWAMQSGGMVAAGVLPLFSALTLWNVYFLRDFYLRPLDRETLCRYEKYDQYIYLPYLGKILQRLIRMRGEGRSRIFVWGTFSQLYHYIRQPAADNFLHYTIGPWDTQDLEGFFDGVIGGLIRHKPLYLIKGYPDLDLELLEKITGLRYRLVKVALCRFPVFRLETARRASPNPLTLSWQEKMRLLDRLTEGEWHAPGIERSDLQPGRMRIALKECRTLIRLNPHDTQGLIFLGEIYDLSGRPEKSAAAFQVAIREEPLRGHVRLMRAKQLIKLGFHDEAEALIQEETQRIGKNIETIFLRGLLHQRKANYREAIVRFEKFRNQKPERSDCWEALVESLTALKDRENLNRLFAEAERIDIRRDREWIHARIANAMAAIDCKRQPEHQTLDHFIQRSPGNMLLVYAKASALERAGETDFATRLFEEVASSATYDHIRAAAWYRLARLSPIEMQKDFARRCLHLEPSHGGARNLLLNSQTGTRHPVTEKRAS